VSDAPTDEDDDMRTTSTASDQGRYSEQARRFMMGG
jgi:hypothetical protein